MTVLQLICLSIAGMSN